MTTESLETLLPKLKDAQQRYDEAKERESKATLDLTARKNELNNLQKEIDTAVEDLKENSPWDTDWYNQRKIT